MDKENKATLKTICRDRIDNVVQNVFDDILNVFHKTGDDFILPKNYNEAIDNLAEDLEFMLLNNPTHD